MDEDSNYTRILIKISGEALASDNSIISQQAVSKLIQQIKKLKQKKYQIALVLGAGNIFRGASLHKEQGINQVVADQAGMLGTLMNAMILSDLLQQNNIKSRVLNSFNVDFCEFYNPVKAIEYLKQSEVILLAGGTSNPFFTTDTCACLRAVEIQADLLLKATKVNGIYSDDPKKNPDATKYDTISYDEVINKELRVMDLTSICLAKDNQLKIKIFDMNLENAYFNAITQDNFGSIIQN